MTVTLRIILNPFNTLCGQNTDLLTFKAGEKELPLSFIGLMFSVIFSIQVNTDIWTEEWKTFRESMNLITGNIIVCALQAGISHLPQWVLIMIVQQ
jgi:hypothetical protein